jgi:hypothetical protein
VSNTHQANNENIGTKTAKIIMERSLTFVSNATPLSPPKELIFGSVQLQQKRRYTVERESREGLRRTVQSDLQGSKRVASFGPGMSVDRATLADHFISVFCGFSSLFFRRHLNHHKSKAPAFQSSSLECDSHLYRTSLTLLFISFSLK